MATVIDELIVSLGIDASKFSAGQQKATESLRKIEQQAERTGKRTGSTLSDSLNKYLNTLSDPIKEGIKSLSELGETGLSSGNLIARGAGRAATGVAALTAAGLAAYATFKAVQGVVSGLIHTMGTTAAVGRLAQWMGGEPGTVPALSRIAIAAHIGANVPQEQTMQSLFDLQQDIQNLYTKGVFSEKLRSLAYLGVTNYGRGTAQDVQRILEQLSRVLPQRTPEQAQALLGGVLPRGLIQILQQGPQALNRYLAEAGPIAQTDRQTQALTREQQALNRLNDTWLAFVRTLETEAAPEITQLINMFDRWLLQLQTSPETLKRVEVAILALGAAITGGIIAKLLRLLPLWARVLAGLAFITDFTTSHGLGGILPESKTDEQLRNESRKSIEDVEKQRRRTEGMPWYQRLWENLIHSFGDMPPEEKPIIEPPTADPRGLENYIRTKANQYGIDPDVAVRVARSEGLGGYVGDQGTSFGAFQLHRAPGALGTRFEAETGLNLADPNTERAQIDWALSHLAETGWSPYHGAARSGVTNWQGIGLGYSPAMTYNQGLGMVRNYNAGSNTNTTNNNQQDTDVNIGAIHVQGGPNAYQTGGAIASAIKRQLTVSQANTGLE